MLLSWCVETFFVNSSPYQDQQHKEINFSNFQLLLEI